MKNYPYKKTKTGSGNVDNLNCNLIPKGLIVSCQALKNEPLYGGDTMPKMAYAAYLGGAVGIRANTVKDINAINKKLDGKLPIIGLIKKVYPDSPIYITPTLKEVKSLIKSNCSVIALDATQRFRPHGEKLEDLVRYIREHSNKKIMADIATYSDALNAEKLGFDLISTTLRSYTEETKGIAIPDIEFCKKLYNDVKKSDIVAEGGIHTFEQVDEILNIGIKRIIIGAAITRPLEITKYYKNVFDNNDTFNGVTY